MPTRSSEDQPRERGGDEPLRGLAAPGPSKVGIEKAMRARDVSRPRAAGLPRDPPPSAAGPHSDGGAGSSGSSPDRS